MLMKRLKDVPSGKIDALIEIGTLINSKYSDIDALLTYILESAMRLVSCESSSILFIDSSGDKLFFSVALGPKGVEAKKFIVDMKGSVAGWVAMHNEPVIINDVAHDPRHDTQVQDSTGYLSKNMIAVPMRIGDKCIGVIELLNKTDDVDFTAEDMFFLQMLADQSAVAYSNASAFVSSRNEISALQDQLLEKNGYHTLIAKSPEMLEKLDIVSRVADSDSSVLILGESGVGKELVAEQLHLQSSRAKGSFVRVNCAVLPEPLLESELFGHIRGAFTDAVSNRKGRFEIADGGTIFLDEIDDLPLSVQGKLLRVLQTHSFERVGSSETIFVNVRIIAATNRDLEKLVEEKKFRSDLYYRLNVIPLYIPPLRRRLEDIPELVSFFMKKFGREVNKSFIGISEEAMSALFSYSWPGNVRELENVIERACVIGNPPYITEENLLLNNKTIPDNTYEDKSLKSVLSLFKKHYIQKILAENEWNQTAAAKVLDIQRTYLSRIMKELGIKEK